MTSFLTKHHGNLGNKNAALLPELHSNLVFHFDELKALAQAEPTATRIVRGAVGGMGKIHGNADIDDVYLPASNARRRCYYR